MKRTAIAAIILVAGHSALQAGISLDRSDRQACWFTVQVPEARLEKAGGPHTRVSLEGFGPEVLPGKPAIPSGFVFVAVPEGARVTVQAEPGKTGEFNDIRLQPQPVLVPGSAPGMGVYEYAEDEEAYSQHGFSPRAAAELVTVEPLRQLTLARIRINPAQYDPAAGRLRIHGRIQVKVSWDPPDKGRGRNDDAAFDRAYASLAVNYAQARDWARGPAPEPSKDGDPFDRSNRWFRMPVVNEGVYWIDHGYLLRHGIDPATIDPRTVKIFNGGSRALPKDYIQSYPDSLTQSAIWVKGEEDGRFDTGDLIVFYAQDLSGWAKNSALATPQFHNPYCDTNVYWLAWGGEAGLRMQTVNGEPQDPGAHAPSAFTDTLHFEQDAYNPFNSGEIWYWSSMGRGNSEQTRLYSLGFYLPEPEGGACGVRISYRAATSGWHRMRWGVNGAFARDLRWSGNPGSGELSDTASCSASTGTNRLDLELVKETADTTDGIHFNWFEVSYRRAFRAVGRRIKFRVDSAGHQRHRVTLTGLASENALILDIGDPARPRRIATSRVYPSYAEFEDGWRPGNRYLAAAPEAWRAPAAMSEYQPQRLRSAFLDARYLIIAPDELWTAAQKLAARRGQDTWLGPVRIVRLSWVYNEFGFGLRQPAAVRNFLKHLYLSSNRTSPAYCLLFGNGNFDYRYLNRSLPNVNLVPSYQGDALSAPLGEYRFDAHDDWFAHFETSNYPQFSIARLPATGPAEAEAVVSKLFGYASSHGPWRNRAILMADDQFSTSSSAEWVHTRDTETLSNSHLPGHYDRCKVYGIEYPKVDRTKPAAKARLISDWNQGASLVNFIGHGSWWTWGHEEYFRDIDVPYLSNGEKLPFVLTASCGISRFDNPNYRCINAGLVAKGNGGAIATFGDMREGLSGANFLLNHSVYAAVFQDGLDLGQSVFTAKFRTQSVAYNNRPYVLLGDPGIYLANPRHAITLTLGSDTLLCRGRYAVTGRVEEAGALPSGQVLVRIFDVPTRVDSSGTSYYQPGKAISQGLATVSGDSFKYVFNVPDLYYSSPKEGCRISAYAWGSSGDAAGTGAGTIWIGGLDTTRVNDQTGPAVSLTADGDEVREGDFISARARLAVRLSDPLGINITPGVQEGEIRTWLDNEAYQDLSQSFIYDLDSDSSGRAEYSPRLSLGGHLLTVRAYDSFGNQTTFRRSFRVADDNSSLEMVYNYPNPTAGGTHFTFQLPEPADVTIRVFTVAGRLIRTIEAPGLGAGYRQVFWDCRDQAGDQLANGVYLYKVTMRGAGRDESKYSKLVIMR